MISDLAVSIAVYAFVCGANLLFGSTVLRFLRPGLPRGQALLLAPAVTSSFWVVALSLGIRLGHSVQHSSITVWLLTLAVCAVGVWLKLRTRRPNAPSIRRWVLLLCIAAPVAAMAPAFWYGLDNYYNHFFCDPFIYVMEGRHAWVHHFRDPTYTHLRPIYTVAWGLYNLRVAGPALEGFFSRCYVPGEVRTGANLYAANSLLILASATAAWVWGLTRRAWLAACAAVFVVGLRWVGNIIVFGNLDNLFAISYLPACLALVQFRGRIPWGGAVLLGLFLATVVVAYPEGFLAMGPVAVALGWAWLRLPRRRTRLYWMLGSLLAFAVFANVELSMLISNIKISYSAALRSAPAEERPGGTAFAGLLGRSSPQAFLGMGTEWGPLQPPTGLFARLKPYRNPAAVAFGLALLFGCLVALRRKRLDLLVGVACLLSGSLYFLLRHQYPYGAYKVLTFVQPLQVGLVCVGLASLARMSRWVRFPLVGAVGLASLVLIAPYWAPGCFPETAIPARSTRPYAEIGRLVTTVTAGTPILLDVPDLVSNCWLEYYLCDLPVCNLHPQIWLSPGYIPSADRPQPEQCRFLLTAQPTPPYDFGSGWAEVLQIHGFHLWKRFDGDALNYLKSSCPLRLRWSPEFYDEEPPPERRRWCSSRESSVTLFNLKDRAQTVEVNFLADSAQAAPWQLLIQYPGHTTTVNIPLGGGQVCEKLIVPTGETTLHFVSTAETKLFPRGPLTFAVLGFRVQAPGSNEPADKPVLSAVAPPLGKTGEPTD